MRLPLLLSAAMILTACGTPALEQAAPASKPHKTAAVVAGMVASAKRAVVTDLGHRNGPSLVVDIGQAQAGYTLQALMHRWLVSDIEYYMVTLEVQTNEGWSPALDGAVKVSPEGAPVAAFTGLAPNKVYRITLDAYGSYDAAENTKNLGDGKGDNRDGERHMNAEDASNTATYDFSEDQQGMAKGDILDTVRQTIHVKLDDYAFAGDLSVDAVAHDGEFVPAGTPRVAQ